MIKTELSLLVARHIIMHFNEFVKVGGEEDEIG